MSHEMPCNTTVRFSAAKASGGGGLGRIITVSPRRRQFLHSRPISSDWQWTNFDRDRAKAIHGASVCRNRRRADVGMPIDLWVLNEPTTGGGDCVLCIS